MIDLDLDWCPCSWNLKVEAEAGWGSGKLYLFEGHWMRVMMFEESGGIVAKQWRRRVKAASNHRYQQQQPPPSPPPEPGYSWARLFLSHSFKKKKKIPPSHNFLFGEASIISRRKVMCHGLLSANLFVKF